MGAALASMATNMHSFDSEAWASGVGFMEPFKDVIDEVRSKMEIACKPAEELEDEDDEGVDLYKGRFSLAYGTLTLLRDAKMHLKRDGEMDHERRILADRGRVQGNRRRYTGCPAGA